MVMSVVLGPLVGAAVEREWLCEVAILDQSKSKNPRATKFSMSPRPCLASNSMRDPEALASFIKLSDLTFSQATALGDARRSDISIHRTHRNPWAAVRQFDALIYQQDYMDRRMKVGTEHSRPVLDCSGTAASG